MNEIIQFSSDTENAEKNYKLAQWYESQNHTAPAHTYYLRAAERSEDKLLSYKSLIRASFCYKKQGSRDGTEKVLLENALMVLPNRPEAYYFLSLLYERREDWQGCYINSNLGLGCYDGEIEELDIPEYLGKYGLIFQKAISSWWWGRGNESRKLFQLLSDEYYDLMDTEHQNSTDDNMNRLGLKRNKKIVSPVKREMVWGIPNDAFISQISKEIFEEKIYERFYKVKEGDVVVDIGASSGAFTYSILDKKPKQIFSIEPSENFFNALEKNAEGYPVKCINKAIVSQQYNKDEHLYVFWAGEQKKINTITFKEFIDENKIDHINLLKSDCESGEYDIFTEENLDFLLNHVDNIAAEFHHVSEYDENHHKFKHFYDNILPKFSYHKIYDIGSGSSYGVELPSYLKTSDQILKNNNNQLLIYISKTPFPESKKMIVDCFRFFNEKELLELRYKMLKDYVDVFVILEGNRTQSGILRDEYLASKYIKELNLPEEKFIVIHVDLPSNDEDVENTEEDIIFRSLSGKSNDTYKNSVNARTRERLLLNSLLTIKDRFDDNAVFFVSDCDEIIKPENIPYFSSMTLKNKNQLIKIPLIELQGRANLRAYDADTNTPICTDNVFFMCTKSHFNNATPFQMRFNINNPYETVYLVEGGNRLEECGWHFSWMGNNERLKLKQKSTSHYADHIESATIKDMNSTELEEFIENWKPKNNGINPWGDKRLVLKEYLIDNLPKEIIESENLRNFFLSLNDSSRTVYKDSNGYDVVTETTTIGHNRYSKCIEQSLNLSLNDDTKLPDWILKLQGMSGKKYRMFINNLIHSIDNPRYLEIGCWKGSTFCSAIYSNKITALGIDDWSEFFGPKEQFHKNLKNALSDINKNTISFIEKDFKQVNFTEDAKYNIYFFDGPHAEYEHSRSLTQVYDSLDDEFIFICDDWNWEEVRRGTVKSLNTAGIEVVYQKQIFTNGKEEGNEGENSDWHNGYYIAVCRKQRTAPIPVIGVPIVNGVHWLKRLINSIDYPVKEFFIINNNGKGEIDKELDEIVNTGHPLIENLRVSHLPANLGVSGSWNLIIKSYINSPYWIIVNNDICFSSGLLKKINEEALQSDSGIIHAKESDWGGGSYDLFLIKDWVIQECGLFDENLYPAYAEDVDYAIRVKNKKIKSSFLNIDYLHGESNYEVSGSQTWRLNMELKEKLDNSRIMNESLYLTQKWGDEYFSSDIYTSPFNNDNYDVRYTSYDLNFIRAKYLGF
jgi:FkbM family methyltransferase